MAITGVHAILYSDDAAADRAFFADVLGLTSVDAGGGWLIFALPPAELAAHPASADGGGYELYLMCDDIEATVRELAGEGRRVQRRRDAAALGAHHHHQTARRRPARALRAAAREPAAPRELSSALRNQRRSGSRTSRKLPEEVGLSVGGIRRRPRRHYC